MRGIMPWQVPDKGMASSVAPTPWHCNPYWHAMKLLADKDALRHFTTLASFDSSLKKQPICYIYGAEKNTHFHMAAQLEKLRSTPGCEVHAVADAGHWCYKHAPAYCHAVVSKFICGV